MSDDRAKRYQDVAIVGLALLAALSCIGAPFPEDLVLQHAPTLLLIAAYVATRNRWRFGPWAFFATILFMCLHILGGRYVYSYVPYDEWALRILNQSISGLFGFERNHYDRLVHFSYGLLLSLPAREILIRTKLVNPRWAGWFAIESIVATSALYELGEWLVAITFAPDWADRYLGQQGDVWDAQKDMALALCGAVITMGVVEAAAYLRRRLVTSKK